MSTINILKIDYCTFASIKTNVEDDNDMDTCMLLMDLFDPLYQVCSNYK